MRKPTAKELRIMRSCLEGLKADIDDIEAKENVPYETLQTFGVNLEVLTRIRKRLLDEDPKP